MIKEAIESILTLAPAAKEGRVKELDNRHTRFYRQYDGTLREFECQPPRSHVAANVRDFVQAVQQFKGGDGDPRADVFIGEKSVVCNLDTVDRLDTVTLPLVFSEAMRALDTLRANQDISQNAFIRTLETTLAGCVGDDVLTKVKTVKVTNRGEVKSHVSQGKRSMGQDIDSEVEGSVEIPETIIVDLPVYSNLDLRKYRVQAQCRLIVTPEIKFTLFITSEERQRVIDETLEYLHGTLVKAGCDSDRTFIGTP